MTNERKNNWKCHLCKPRTRSASNNSLDIVSCEDNFFQKQQRENEEVEEGRKRFKDSISLNELQSDMCTVKSDLNDVKLDVNDVKNNIKELKTSVEQLSVNVTQSNISFKDEIKTALSQITATLSNLATQVVEMRNENKENKQEINNVNNKINVMEQQIISKKIEIKNIHNNDIDAFDVVKTIGTSINVNINEYDISDVYRLKKTNDKIIVEFTTQNKKREFMKNIKRHRIQSNILNDEGINNFIYINDCLTAHNRKLLWLAKTKAKESNWKFVWTRSGSIFARKTENSPSIFIRNTADIKLIA